MEPAKTYSIVVRMVSDRSVCMDGYARKYFTVSVEEYSGTPRHSSTSPKIVSMCFNENTIQTVVWQHPVRTAEYQLSDIRRIGHRGNGCNSKRNQKPRENTIESFVLAHSKGAQMVEMDVQLTADKQLVVFHDHAIRGKLVAEMTYQEFLLESNSSCEDFCSTNTTLENILEALPDDLAVYLEIKHKSNATNYPPDYANEVVEYTLELVKRYPERRILFASFSPYTCVLIKTCCPSYKVCFLMCNSTLDYVSKESLVDTIAEFVTGCKIDGVICDTGFYPEAKELFGKIEGKAKLLYGKNTNDTESITRFRELGFSGFCTDDLSIH